MAVEVQGPHAASWWSSSSWFAGGGLQEAPQAALVPQQRPISAEQHEQDGLTAVGGAKAQSRFSGRTAIPMATCTPLSGSGAGAAAPASVLDAAAHPRPQPQREAGGAGAAQPAAGRHAAWAGASTGGVGRTVDGSLPSRASAGEKHEHVSRWVFDTQRWQWAVKGQPGETLPSEKHQLAARRWGDGRDALGAAVAAQQGAPAAPSSAAAPAEACPRSPQAAPKRPRLRVSAMTGDASDAGFAAVGGLQRQKDALMEQVAVPLAHPKLFARLGVPAARGVLLHGPPGSGKTHLVRALAAEARLPIVHLSGGQCVGEEAERMLRSAFNQAKAQAPSILLLDELDALAPARSASHSEHERQATARLLAAVDALRASRARVGLVGATNRREAVDPALRRAGRLDSEVALAALHADERLQVMRCVTRRMPLAPDVCLEGVAARLRGYVAADVAAVCSEAALLCASEAVAAAEAAGRVEAVGEPQFLAGLRVRGEHFEAALARLGPSVLRGLAPEVPDDVSWDAIGGLEEAKRALHELVDFPLAHAPLLQAYGLPAPRGALLYGPPGCGKTLLAKAAAAQCGANFLSVRGPELLKKWLGESEAAVRRVFETARQAAPCLIFFDEIDSIACRRGSGGGAAGDATGARVLNQLLVEMDGMADRGGVFVLCATNRPEALDPALTRPGRLDHLVRVPLPDAAARRAILASSLRRCPLAADVDLEALAGEATQGFSGADLAEVCRRAGMAAIRELVAAEEGRQVAEAGAAGGHGGPSCGEAATPPLQQQHLAEALASMRRSVSEAEDQRHALMEERLRDGSLPAPPGQQQQQDRQLAALVRAAAQGSLARLQARVAQLEAALADAGLQVPPEEA